MLVIVLSGIYLVYRAELDRWLNPEIRTRPLARILFPSTRCLGRPGNSFPGTTSAT